MFLKALTLQHPIYGIHRANIAAILTLDNWIDKAVVRIDRHEPERWFYLWIREISNGSKLGYVVCCVSNYGGVQPHVYENEFSDLDKALAYINGEGALDVQDSLDVQGALNDEDSFNDLARDTVSTDQSDWRVAMLPNFQMRGQGER